MKILIILLLLALLLLIRRSSKAEPPQDKPPVNYGRRYKHRRKRPKGITGRKHPWRKRHG